MEPEAEIIRAQLFALQDETYRTFHSALMPTVPPETVIGVRVPALRRLAKQLAGTAQAEVFLQALPHGYYEENNLHAFLIELIRDYDRALAETEAFHQQLGHLRLLLPQSVCEAQEGAAGAHSPLAGFGGCIHRALWHGDADALLSG